MGPAPGQAARQNAALSVISPPSFPGPRSPPACGLSAQDAPYRRRECPPAAASSPASRTVRRRRPGPKWFPPPAKSCTSPCPAKAARREDAKRAPPKRETLLTVVFFCSPVWRKRRPSTLLGPAPGGAAAPTHSPFLDWRLQKADSKCHSPKYTKENIRFAAKKLTGPTELEIISSIYLQTVRMICRQFNMAAFRAHIARHCTSLFTFKKALLLVYKLYFDILCPCHFCLEHFSITSVTLHSRVLLKF